jgi:hypothetical protein
MLNTLSGEQTAQACEMAFYEKAGLCGLHRSRRRGGASDSSPPSGGTEPKALRLVGVTADNQVFWLAIEPAKASHDPHLTPSVQVYDLRDGSLAKNRLSDNVGPCQALFEQHESQARIARPLKEKGTPEERQATNWEETILVALPGPWWSDHELNRKS